MSDRNDQIIQAVKSGMTYGEAAAEFKVTRNVVAGICHRAGLKVSNQPGRRDRMLYALGGNPRSSQEMVGRSSRDREGRAHEASRRGISSRRNGTQARSLGSGSDTIQAPGMVGKPVGRGEANPPKATGLLK